MKYAGRTINVLTLFLALFSFFYCYGQVPQKSSSEIWIDEINRERDRINNDTARLKVVQKDVFGQSTEGGFLRTYYEDKILRKAILTLFGENGQSTSEYYLLNGNIICVNHTGIRYQSPVYMGKTEIESQVENRFYFNNQKLIQWVTQDGHLIPPGQYPEKEKEILDDFKIIQ